MTVVGSVRYVYCMYGWLSLNLPSSSQQSRGLVLYILFDYPYTGLTLLHWRGTLCLGH